MMVVIKCVAVDSGAGEVVATVVTETLVTIHAELLAWLAGLRRLLLDTIHLLFHIM